MTGPYPKPGVMGLMPGLVTKIRSERINSSRTTVDQLESGEEARRLLSVESLLIALTTRICDPLCEVDREEGIDVAWEDT